MSEDPAPGSGLDGLGWVRRTHERPIGRTEYRQVRMRIGSGVLARNLRIRTLRQAVGDEAQSVYCLMDPWPLAGTNFSLHEKRGSLHPFRIQLYLPFGRKAVRELSSERRRESLLGSDFAYDDFRTWLYLEGHVYELLDKSSASVIVRGRCVDGFATVRTGQAAFDVAIDAVSTMVRSVDVRSEDGKAVVRRFTAEDISTIDGVLIPGLMRMRDLSHNHETVIELEHAWYDRPIDPGIFETRARPGTRAYFSDLS